MAPPAFQAEPIALLIDGENVSSEYAVYMLAAAGKFGGVTVRRVYGNWAHASMKPWQNIATHYNILTVHYQPPISGKNATDIKLVVDAMELWHAGMRRFCLVGSDSDYTPLVQRLNELGCFVLGIGKAETSPILKKACTVFLSLKDLPPPTPIPQPKVTSAPTLVQTPAQPPQVVAEVVLVPEQTEEISQPSGVNGETPLQKLLIQAYKQVVAEEGEEWVPLSKLGLTLRKLDPAFKMKDHGASTLKVLIQKHTHTFEMKNLSGHPAARIKSETGKKKKS
jgi:hypothetical protein